MKRLFSVMAIGCFAVSMTSCARITSQVVEKPRVDQEIQGNQGYLAGSGPGTRPSRKSTRKIIQTDIELLTAQELNPWRVRRSTPLGWGPGPAEPAPQEELQPMVEEEAEVAPQTRSAPVAPQKTHIVKNGDSLEKIAAREYGDSKKWRVIYEANRDRLPSPNRIYPGQTLVIPEVSSEKGHRRSSDLK